MQMFKYTFIVLQIMLTYLAEKCKISKIFNKKAYQQYWFFSLLLDVFGTEQIRSDNDASEFDILGQFGSL